MIARKPRWSSKELYWAADYITYRKLKALKRWIFEFIYSTGNWRRWAKKTVYRSSIEPPVCPAFIDLKLAGSKIYPDNWLIKQLLDCYNTVKRPYDSPDQVPVISATDLQLIDSTFAEAQQWFAEVHKEPNPLPI